MYPGWRCWRRYCRGEHRLPAPAPAPRRVCGCCCCCLRPRDEIARQSDIAVHERGGVIVDDYLRTNDEDIYAIGEVALHG